MNSIEEIAESLGLDSAGQDWGIEHADGGRLAEFIAFYEAHAPLSPQQSEALADLVLQSAQEAIDSGLFSKELLLQTVRFFARHRKKFPTAAGYWLGLNQQEWAITHLLHQAGAGV